MPLFESRVFVYPYGDFCKHIFMFLFRCASWRKLDQLICRNLENYFNLLSNVLHACPASVRTG